MVTGPTVTADDELKLEVRATDDVAGTEEVEVVEFDGKGEYGKGMSVGVYEEVKEEVVES